MLMKNLKEPNVWVLQTGRLGDNVQAWSLATTLGWSAESKRLRFNVLFAVPNFFVGKSLVSLDQQASDVFQPPWPDLVIGVGRRTVPIARWIKDQSGGKTKLVHLGRPRASNSQFNLVISSPQYRITADKNVFHTLLPLPTTPEKLSKEEASYWHQAFERYPKPWVGILLGGAKWPYSMTSEIVERLAEQAGKLDGSMIVTTSPRTPPRAASVIRDCLGERAFVHVWDAGQLNPYRSILAYADRFIVTGDSATMLSESCATGRQVDIFDLPHRESSSYFITPGNILSYTGLVSPPRNMTTLHAGLVESGHATFLGKERKKPIPAPPDDLERAVALVREIMGY
jgi:mitochondrial fission protein ELM1